MLILNTIMGGDCVEIMKALPSGSVDLIFADPPYNLQLSGGLKRPDASVVKGVDHEWDRFETFAAYDEFIRAWMAEARRLLTDSGSIWVSGSYHNIFRVGAIMQDVGFWILNDIIWRKSNPMPNFRGTRFTNAHETLIWAAKTEASKPTFNYKSMKAFNGDVQMRSDWLIPICSGNERLRDDDGGSTHPTQKPEALLERILLATSKPGQVVLDPFFGTGTTGAVAKRLGRNFIGIERDAGYRRVARKRIQAVTCLPDELLEVSVERKDEQKIPFSTLLDLKLIAAGQQLVGPTPDVTATIRVDSSLVMADGLTGSIHQLAKQVSGNNGKNGWDYWSYVDGVGKAQAINNLRIEARLIMNSESA
jgi:modification methylase